MSHIKITKQAYEEPHHLNLILEASDETQSTSLECYCNVNDLTDIADHLEVFPKHNSDVFLYELDSEKDDRYAFFLRMRVFLTDRFR